MGVSQHSRRPDQGGPSRLPPGATNNSDITGSTSNSKRIDMSYLFNPEMAAESEHETLFAGHRKQASPPVAPSPQSSPTGAKSGRTPLPDGPPPPSTGSTSSSGAAFTGLHCLAEAASIVKPSPKSPARPQGGLTTYLEAVLEDEKIPMTASAIHAAVVKLTGYEYKNQSVRKALCDKASPFEPLNNGKWALKSWGLSPSRMARKYGTGWGTMEARKKRAAAANL